MTHISLRRPLGSEHRLGLCKLSCCFPREWRGFMRQVSEELDRALRLSGLEPSRAERERRARQARLEPQRALEFCDRCRKVATSKECFAQGKRGFGDCGRERFGFAQHLERLSILIRREERAAKRDPGQETAAPGLELRSEQRASLARFSCFDQGLSAR